LVYAGYAPAYDRVVFRGDPASLEFVAFWLRDNRVVAGINVNVWDVNEDIQGLIRSGCTVDDDALRDADVALGDLAAT
jgi:3-phenylpropionate/trans-cinnamate dioxygenase ferredoxin reductase subunit